jgi:hypothetical protein
MDWSRLSWVVMAGKTPLQKGWLILFFGSLVQRSAGRRPGARLLPGNILAGGRDGVLSVLSVAARISAQTNQLMAMSALQTRLFAQLAEPFSGEALFD